MKRTLQLRREVLTELRDIEMRAVGGGGTETILKCQSDTCYSCMTFVSCYATDCNCLTAGCA